MRMIPASPHGTGSMAEKRVFDRLKNIFNDPKDGPMTAYHSLNLTDHRRKRFGEIDFLICGKPGLFVLEVKGGKISCRKGVWTFTDRYGVQTRSVEGPFKQAESALHGLMTKLKTQFKSSQIACLPIGYGVLFPDCEWRQNGAEWENSILLDSRSFNNLESWMKSLFSYWQNRHASAQGSDNDFLNELSEYLRPEFETVETLFCQIGNVSEKVARLTRDQMAFIDVIEANKKVLCYGGAGTGKTFLALELARRWAYAGKRVVMPCGSKWLKRYLETRFCIPGLTLTTVSSVELEAGRAGLDQFDAMIVDEGQDVFHWQDFKKLDCFLKGGLKDGQWCIFHDINNQATSANKPDTEVLNFLETLNPARVPLNTNCRNTLNIINEVKNRLGANMGIKGAGHGPDVRQNEVCSRKEAATVLAGELSHILESGHIPSGSITILSPLPLAESAASLLPPEFREQICVLDEFAMRNFPPLKISFSQIDQFKGLENEVVILVDVPPPNCSKKEDANYYIAMSRPRSLLSMIFTVLNSEQVH